jgi:RsiW-degrading membrane proteinase PrsW (M82 family)
MVFGTSLIIPPILAMIAELIIILAAIIVLILAIPATSDTVYRFQALLSSASSNSPLFEQEIFDQLATLFQIPAVTIFTLAIFSLFVPLIEETFKIIMLIPLGAIVSDPDLGFVLGILCGAAFALVENVGFTSSGVNDWTINILTRSTAALPHIFNSGIIGWAYFQTIKDRKWHKLLLAFCLAIFIHGSWNGASVSMAINSLNPGNANDVFFQNIAWFSLWGMLTLGTFSGIVFVNNFIHRHQRLETIQKAEV